MKYLSEDFLLHCETARRLYHDAAETMPILDYHSHLSPRDIATDRRFETITELWLSQDHYKWRLMRANGVDERFITGNASDEEKFVQWAATLPRAIRNPLYDWSHLELKTYFGISDVLLSGQTASEVYEKCNEKLREPAFSAKNLLRLKNVAVVCTTDDPVDSLAYHAQIREQGFEIAVVPSFRVDKILAARDPSRFNDYVGFLSAAASTEIFSYDSLIQALDIRHSFFHEAGCRVADLAFSDIPAEKPDDVRATAVFAALRLGRAVSAADIQAYQSTVVRDVCRMNQKRKWVQQFHFGVIRNPRTRLLKSVGLDAGADCIGDGPTGQSLCTLLDSLDQTGQLGKTVLYNINPRDNELVANIAESFQDGSCPAKMQLGPAWWFSDNRDGIAAHLSALSASGLLGRFIGMTTDSRSLLSFARHEYFRRIMCDFLGAEMERGDIPGDTALAQTLVKNICYASAREYFGFLTEENKATRRKAHECALVS